jgi:hypothetical protein
MSVLEGSADPRGAEQTDHHSSDPETVIDMTDASVESYKFRDSDGTLQYRRIPANIHAVALAEGAWFIEENGVWVPTKADSGKSRIGRRCEPVSNPVIAMPGGRPQPRTRGNPGTDGDVAVIGVVVEDELGRRHMVLLDHLNQAETKTFDDRLDPSMVPLLPPAPPAF